MDPQKRHYFFRQQKRVECIPPRPYQTRGIATVVGDTRPPRNSEPYHRQSEDFHAVTMETKH